MYLLLFISKRSINSQCVWRPAGSALTHWRSDDSDP